MRPVPAVFHVHHEHGHSVLIGVRNHLGGVGIVPSDLHVRVVRVNTIVGIGIVVNLAHLGAIEVISVVNTRYGLVGIHSFNQGFNLLRGSGFVAQVGGLLHTVGIIISVVVITVVKLCDFCCVLVIYSGNCGKTTSQSNQCDDEYMLLSDNNTCLPRGKNTELIEFDSCLELTLEDGKYICSRCKEEFSNDLNQLKLISCPLEASNLIHEGECRDYVLLEKKCSYELLEDRAFICNTICPVMGKHVRIQTKDGSYFDGIVIDTHAYARNITENFLTILNKKGGNQNEYTNILISDISKILF